MNWQRTGMMMGVATVAVVLAPGGPEGLADSEPGLMSALDEFPARDRLQEQVRAARDRDPQAFAAAQEDFDLSIRSALQLEPPKHPGYVLPHVVRDLVLKGCQFSYPMMESHIADLEQREGWEAVADFYRQHIDEFCVADTPELRWALVDALLNEWSDWSGWESDGLRKYREHYPDLHRDYALRMLHGIRVAWGFGRSEWDRGPDVAGPALDILIDSSQPRYVREAARRYVKSTVDSPQALGVLFGTAKREGTFVAGCMRQISSRVDANVRRAFWDARLNEGPEWLRLLVVRELAQAVSAIRTYTKGEDKSPDVVARLRQVADNDPDPKVRQEAARQLANFRLETDEPEDVRRKHLAGGTLPIGPDASSPSTTPASGPEGS